MSKINNYDELITERRRLEIQIAEQKLVLKEEFSGLKNQLEPFLNLLPVLNIFRKKEPSRSLLSTISSLGIDLLGQKFLTKTSWIMRLILPLIAKGVTSRVMSHEKSNGNIQVRVAD